MLLYCDADHQEVQLIASLLFNALLKRQQQQELEFISKHQHDPMLSELMKYRIKYNEELQSLLQQMQLDIKFITSAM
jgi:hypothetical protein